MWILLPGRPSDGQRERERTRQREQIDEQVHTCIHTHQSEWYYRLADVAAPN